MQVRWKIGESNGKWNFNSDKCEVMILASQIAIKSVIVTCTGAEQLNSYLLHLGSRINTYHNKYIISNTTINYQLHLVTRSL